MRLLLGSPWLIDIQTRTTLYFGWFALDISLLARVPPNRSLQWTAFGIRWARALVVDGNGSIRDRRWLTQAAYLVLFDLT